MGACRSEQPSDKEGPLYDFDWNPNGEEFVVVYGFMPAKGKVETESQNL